MIKKSIKINKHNTSKIKPTNLVSDKDCSKSPWLEDYLDCFSLKLQPVTEAFILRISKELIHWAKNDVQALRIADFYWNKGISDTTYYRWCKQHEFLGLAHRAALNFIASRREKGALFRTLDKDTVFKRQHAYDPEWEADRQREKQDKIDIGIAIKTAEHASEKKNITVVMSCYEKHSNDTDNANRSEITQLKN